MPPRPWPGKFAPRFGARVGKEGIRFAVWSGAADRAVGLAVRQDGNESRSSGWNCSARQDGTFARHVPGLKRRHALRISRRRPTMSRSAASGSIRKSCWSIPTPSRSTGPLSTARSSSRPRGEGGDTAPLVPKAVAVACPNPVPAAPPLFKPGGFVYELPVRAFTMLHPDIPEKQRGTVGGARPSGRHRAPRKTRRCRRSN